VTRLEHKRRLLLTIAKIISLNDDLMPDYYDEGPDAKRWREVRDDLVEEFERRGGLS
jgi:hypothetical protein